MARLSQADRKRLQNAMEALIDEAGAMLDEERARTAAQRAAGHDAAQEK